MMTEFSCLDELFLKVIISHFFYANVIILLFSYQGSYLARWPDLLSWAGDWTHAYMPTTRCIGADRRGQVLVPVWDLRDHSY